MKVNEELEQLLKNLKLRRVLDIYDEQLRAAEKEDASYTEFMTRLMRAQWARPSGTRPGMAHPQCQVARTLVAGYVPLCSSTRRQSQTDPHLRRTRLRHQKREHHFYWPNRRGQDRISIGDSA